MHRIAGIAVLVLVLQLLPDVAEAREDGSVTFSECVLGGGAIRVVSGELTCRLIWSSDFRVYGSGTTECGEEVFLEHWGETRQGIVTYPLANDRAVELPEIGLEDMHLPQISLPCLEPEESGAGSFHPARG